MTKYIIDIETTSYRLPGETKGNPSPYIPENKLVTFQAMNVETEEKVCYVFNHKENTQDVQFNAKIVQQILDNCSLFIAHNAKFDASFLYECGFKYSGKFFDTMIMEYICNKGQKSSLGLKDLAIKYNLPLKLDIWEKYWNEGLNTDEMPLEELLQYALGDLDTTLALYNLQRKRYSEDKDTKFMWPAIELTNQALEVIIEMERNGCHIDMEKLQEVEKEYINELSTIDRGINEMVNDLMGDTPINLSSPDDMCKLIYGFEVKDKKAWADKFNIGTSERNGVKKRKWPTRMGPNELKKAIKELTVPVFKTEASQCSTCYGRKKIRKIKKDGTDFKNDSICGTCNGDGVTYVSTNRPAGLRLKPINSQNATAAGFAADKKVIDQYLSRESLNDEVKAFLKALQRQSAITTYLSTFVEGIKKNVRQDMLLHCSINQCITSTGRLSSSNPNLQNQPRDNTFPVRKAFTSRFKDGILLDADWSGVEFRTAVAASEDTQGLKDILDKVDVHQFTADTISSKGQIITRQEAKAHTFKPLFAGMSGTEAEIAYYEEFNKKYAQIHEWQEELVSEAIAALQIKSPSCRIYAFPNVKRKADGGAIGKTQIYNYCIQGFASDLMQATLVELNKKLKPFKSLLILTVHDSLLIDIHPEEKEEVIDLVVETMKNVKNYLKARFNFNTEVPFDFEIKVGKSWGELDKIKLDLLDKVA